MRELSSSEINVVSGGDITTNDVAGGVVCLAAGLATGAIASLVFTPLAGTLIGSSVSGACGIAWAAKD
ncbi:hypothetical protein [Biformimicrobium ophioploci]|uniref:Bacteriocin n=1 Tax=Biformimicrobium ophioploci TaxID=3036711 RepID=A0ABQ6LXP3_9GAMM|nr:hypothetical protein [Microbulbifer sp. NKW57]GMG86863.1 hypothetical protein MNKW57_11840 [Microbulbifer sp. NKW57]